LIFFGAQKLTETTTQNGGIERGEKRHAVEMFATFLGTARDVYQQYFEISIIYNANEFPSFR
jgi:hypothetical protein